MALWEKIHADLRTEFGEAIFRSWLKPLSLQAFYHGTLEVSVPTRFMRDWIQNHYAERILEMCAQAHADVKKLQIVVVQSASFDPNETTATPSDSKNAANDKEASTRFLDEVAEISSPLDPRFTFDSFVVGKPNALAHAAARRVVESASVPFNPLFLYGGVGLGKTHLMHAIAHAMKEQYPEKTIMYLSAEKFMYQFVRALRSNETMNFKEIFRSVDVLMMDDIQFIAGKESTQEEFFHTFNALVDQNKQIIISADKAPSDLSGIDERLRSRLAWGLVADIHPTTYDLRLGILQSKREQLNANVPDPVLEFLALKVTSNIRELEGALNRIVAHADVSGAAVTLESTQEVLQDLLRSHDRRITIDEIQRKVAEHYNLRMTDMHSARRARNVARPRQVAMYLAKQLTARSLPEIGRKFGGRDHTTVMHAVRKVEELLDEDAQIAQDVDIIRRALTG
ncbi:MAG: chromosomal replication initiator protein DnaA [Alphaproteobacteria bacterium]|nr:chromosomal replication initiator protein DnaA [Alphaproteobacteria bacterium]MCD8525814.1 chromosomal replication initiator protein DnaA [Alphaproteobacteria bacterium]MCD8571433.1 chromosomal replication initiator protein DnaA [Alphaproteobacteria bacterium]